MAYSSLSVANAFIELAENEGRAVTNMQLQKLVFFAHGYTLAFLNRPLTNDTVKAWTFGPVYSLLYNSLRHFGKLPVREILPGIPDVQDGEEAQIIKSVWNAYKHHTAYQLSDISHNVGSPWHQVWNSNKFEEIPDNITRDYYRRLI
ncbi:Uncharacterized phage-associated protein [Pasteurella multocida]|nr:Uncharacterized phage-associated protein [Pasteurella multocida]